VNVPPAPSSLAEVCSSRGLHVALISVHGRIRSTNLELGCEPDTGGQTLYVVELARALARTPGIAGVDLFTRRIVDPDVGPDYAEAVEPICDGARIVRIDCGPEGHMRKEELWDHLDSFADNLLSFLREEERHPDVVHGHYADAGYVALRLTRQLGRPLVFTGHSLGRIKRRRLRASGMDRDAIEERFHISRRIEAEEEVLGAADLVLTSTRQELEEQYAAYDQYRPQVMRVVPPGLDLERFHTTASPGESAEIERVLARFLRHPDRPLVLAIARPDERKNLEILVQAFGESPALREAANLVVVAGNRDDLADESEGVRGIFTGLLYAVDRHELYGRVALPKHHAPDDVPRYYRLAARSGGVFVDAALTEPFGLTLLEAAACGLPIVATEDGGPTEIVANCRNGVLVNPLDAGEIGAAVLSVLTDRERWEELSRSGVEGVRAHYSWEAHARDYVAALCELPAGELPGAAPAVVRRRLGDKRVVLTDIDQNLEGDEAALERFRAFLSEHRRDLAFGIATGRRMRQALEFLREHQFPEPDVLISRLGTAIHYAPKLIQDVAWTEHVDHLWNQRAIRRLLDGVPGLHRQAKDEQSVFKVSYVLDADEAPGLDEIVTLLRSNELSANAFLSFGHFLDVVPVRASKGAALRHVADQWGLPLEDVLVAGGSGADEDMMRGNTLAVVVANRHQEELSQLVDVDVDRIYFAEKPYADGILEAIEHYDFLGQGQDPT